jgi:hypothetical protein
MSDPTSTRSVRIAQAVWLVLAVGATTYNAVRIASGWAKLTTICHAASTCGNTQLDTTAARLLSQRGISIDAFAVYAIAISVTYLVIWYGLGALIIWRKPEDRGALVSAFFLLVFPSFLDPSIPLAVTFSGLILFGLLFPDGHFAPRWTRWLALAAILACTAEILSDGVATFATLLIIFPVVAMQIYRFRYVSSWAQRQQIKWALFGLVAGTLGFVGLILLPSSLAPSQAQNGSLLSALLSVTGFELVISAIPLSIGIAVLRSRLWDIDRIISRALVYSTLSATLAAIYIGNVIGLQTLFGLVAGNSSSLAIALSTLAIAALFGPLRRRTQSVIDRRFYRSKYDAEKTLAAFGDRLRDEVDLTQLSQDLTAVVHATLHPRHVSLWLHDGGREVQVVSGSGQPGTDMQSSSISPPAKFEIRPSTEWRL